MRTRIEEFRQRRRLLENLSYQDEKPRLSGFYEWMQSVPELRRMTDALSSKVNVKSLVPPRVGFPKGPQTKNLEDVLAIGLHLLQQTTRPSLHTTAHSLSIRGGSTGQSYTDVCMEKYIEPL